MRVFIISSVCFFIMFFRIKRVKAHPQINFRPSSQKEVPHQVDCTISWRPVPGDVENTALADSEVEGEVCECIPYYLCNNNRTMDAGVAFLSGVGLVSNPPYKSCPCSQATSSPKPNNDGICPNYLDVCCTTLPQVFSDENPDNQPPWNENSPPWPNPSGNSPPWNNNQPGNSPPWNNSSPGNFPPWQNSPGNSPPWNNNQPGNSPPWNNSSPGNFPPWQNTPGNSPPWNNNQPGNSPPWNNNASENSPPWQNSPGNSPPWNNNPPENSPPCNNNQPGNFPPWNNNTPENSPPWQNSPGNPPPWNDNAPGNPPPWNNNRPGNSPPWNNNSPGNSPPWNSKPNKNKPSWNNNQPGNPSSWNSNLPGKKRPWNNNSPGRPTKNQSLGSSTPWRDSFPECVRYVNNGFSYQNQEDQAEKEKYGYFPWVVAVFGDRIVKGTNKRNLFLCGSSLINPGVVLTAAHCIKGKSSLMIRAGKWNFGREDGGISVQERNIHHVKIHEEYYAGALYNDIALLFLETPLEPGPNIGTVCLPEPGDRVNLKDCVVSGWGSRVFGADENYGTALKKIELSIVTRTFCEEKLRTTRLGRYFHLHEGFICAQGKGGQDACTGDGGGPLVCPLLDDSNFYVQVGVVSWGIGCGGDIPGVYVNVTHFRPWIDREMAILTVDERFRQ